LPPSFLDTNVFLRHLLQDHPEHSPRATAFFSGIERGEIEVRALETVIFETVFTLERRLRHSKGAVRDNVLPLLRLPGISLPRKAIFTEILDLYVDLNISIVDAYHAVSMRRLGLRDIVTFDNDFDRIPGIRRIEP